MSISIKVTIGVVLGVLLGYLASVSAGLSQFVIIFLKPLGAMFIHALKMVAVPLVFVSLAKGICDLRDLDKLSSLGGRTIFWYLATSFIALIIGLALVNFFQPGGGLEIAALSALSQTASEFAAPASAHAGPLDIFVRMVPDNIFQAFANNGALLQVIFFTVMFSIALLSIPPAEQEPVLKLITALNHVMLKIVDFIINVSPYAVFALMASLVVEVGEGELFRALLNYSLVLVLGFVVMLLIYPILIALFTRLSPMTFLTGIVPAQLVALTTSSSVATLPVTMECVHENLEVEEEIAAFVCPVGATINMDGTCLMQSIAAIFICQISGFELDLAAQVTIVITALLASIGAAAAPSAGIVMLVMVLGSVGFPSEILPIALSLILAVDRPLDMLRTVVNISGDSCVSVLVAKSKHAQA